MKGGVRKHAGPSARLLQATRVSRGDANRERRTSEAYREILRQYRSIASAGRTPNRRWRAAALDALQYLGGDADRHFASLRDYDHRRYGPFLGVSDDGGGAAEVCRAALASPKAEALGKDASPLAVGVALDAERLGGVGEVAVGLDEFSDIWCQCAGRSLMTTNVGSRVNIRHYLRAPIVTIAAGDTKTALEEAKQKIKEAFGPYLKTPDGKPRPLVVFVEFKLGSDRSLAGQKRMLRELLEYARSREIAAPKVHRLGFNVRIGWGPKGRDAALRAIDLAHAVGIGQVAIDGVVRKQADSAVSLPGLTTYLAPGLVAQVLRYAQRKHVRVHPVSQVDPDTVARSIWSALNSARAMGLHLGKYGLFPLTLEEAENVVSQVQGWFPDWPAAPVFYVDQGIIGRTGVYVGHDTAKGAAKWLRVMAKHRVKVVLIDTVDKAKGWKLLRTGKNDKKGLLGPQQIAQLTALGESLGIKVLWAGGITGAQAYELGKLGVFGIYVTTSASIEVAVTGKYLRDRGLSRRKQPTFAGVLGVKSLLEAGYLSKRAGKSALLGKLRDIDGSSDKKQIDHSQLAKTLRGAWREWWRATS